MKHVFSCHFCDNSGKSQNFTVKASNKQEAIEKAFSRAKKNARGDLSPHWSVILVR